MKPRTQRMNSERSILFPFVCVGVLAAFAGCSDPASDKPQAVIGDAVPAQSEVAASETPTAGNEANAADSQAVAGASYVLSKNCYIGFAGSKIGGVHYGQFPAYEGTVEIQGEDLESMIIDLTMDMTKLQTDDTALTGTLRGENFFDVENHPSAAFLSTSVEKSEEGYIVTGNLTIRGIAKSVRFPASIALEDGQLTAAAEFSIDRTVWGIGNGWVSDTVIRDNIVMELDIEAHLESAK